MKKKIQKWNMAFQAIVIMLGAIVGLSIVYFVKGEFYFSVLLGFLAGAGILIVINIIKVCIKNDRTPDADERTIKNMLKFFVFSSHLFIGLLLVALSISTLTGIEQVSLSYLWIIIISYLWISGVGAFIVSRR